MAGQVVLAAINKIAMWALYYGETQSTFKKTWRYRVAHSLSETYWIDLTLDVAAIAAFAWATWLAFDVAV